MGAPAARRNARYTPLDVDGPLPAEMVRAVPAIRRDPLGFLVEVHRRHGPHVAFPMPRTPVLLVGTAAGARDVLVADAGSWGKATPQYGALAAVTGTGLLTSDGAHWRERRRTVQPAFAHGALAGVARESVAAGCSARGARAVRRCGARRRRGGAAALDPRGGRPHPVRHRRRGRRRAAGAGRPAGRWSRWSSGCGCRCPAGCPRPDARG